MALEEAGELQEAARVFEYAGEHAQAALLRLEYARTLRDPNARLDVLREGCARNPGSTPEGRTLHLALADGLLTQADATDSSARRRNLELEAASAFEEADQGARAGELYEELGLLRKAVAAYERSGEIARLELALEVLERQEQRAQAEHDLIREVDEAISAGRRRLALSLLEEHVHTDAPASTGIAAYSAVHAEHAAPRRTASPALRNRLQLLRDTLVRGDTFLIDWGGQRATHVFFGERLNIGRSPQAQLTLAQIRLSRLHVQLGIHIVQERSLLCATCLGSKVGSFWDGAPLDPGIPTAIEEPGELGLGMSAAIELHPLVGAKGAALGGLVREVGSTRWTLFLPSGGPLWLAPDIQVPARLLPERGLVVLDLATGVEAKLGTTALDPGANLELMAGDRISLMGAPLTMEVVS